MAYIQGFQKERKPYHCKFEFFSSIVAAVIDMVRSNKVWTSSYLALLNTGVPVFPGYPPLPPSSMFFLLCPQSVKGQVWNLYQV